MGGRKFTAEERQWLKDNISKCDNYAALTDMFNKKFCTSYTWRRDGFSPIERQCRAIGLMKNKTDYGFTDQENEWLLQNAKSHSNKWLAENIVSISGRKHDEGAIKHHCRVKLGVYKGMGCHKAPINKKPIGSVTRHDALRPVIKLKDTGDDKKDWYPYYTYLYEQYHRVKLPKGYQVIHLDGNNDNNSKENLCAVSHRENAILACYKWHGKGIITKTGVEYAKLRISLIDHGCDFVDI